jgi:hypothetical protein
LGLLLRGSSLRGETTVEHHSQVALARDLWVELQQATDAAPDQLELAVVDAVHEDHPGV